MNEFFTLVDNLKNRNPLVNIKIESEIGHKFWKISVDNQDKHVFDIMGSDPALLFQNAYHKLQVHRKELL